MRGGPGGRLASGSVRRTTAAAVPEQNRSFSLWARHSAETSAELNVRSGAAEFFPWPAGRCEGEEAAEGRK